MVIKDIKGVFMGTPEFAVASLKKLLENDIHVAAVITAPDKPAGRGRELQSSPVKKFAAEHDLLVLQPANLKDPAFIEELGALHANLQLVVAFRMLPEVVWSMPEYGTVNLHASLLPDYRGAAPINRAIMNGEKKTGVTTFFIEKDIDTGNILFSEEEDIHPDDTAGDLHDRLMHKGAGLLLKTVEAIRNDNFQARSQAELIKDKKSIKKAPKITKDDCRINWRDDMESIYNFIRGLSPYPVAWTNIKHHDEMIMLKIFKVQKAPGTHNDTAGTLHTDNKHYIKVSVKGGYINITELQQAGKKRLAVDEFLRGFPDFNQCELIIY